MKSKRIKLIRQSDSIDCGPTCLSIISSAYKKNFSVEKIKDLCGLSAEGVSLLGISRAAEIIGFRTIGPDFVTQKIRILQLIDKQSFVSLRHLFFG